MKRAVRMADIAQQLGISTVSVSKALAGKSGVSEELRTKVITLAHQMGYSGVRVRYEPGLTGNIGVLVADHLFSGNTFYTDLYRELVLCSSAEGFSCIMEIISQEAEQTAVLPSLAVQQRVDGIIFMGALDPNYLAAVMAVGLPCLAPDFRIPGFQIDSILRDNTDGGFLITKYLLSKGYRRIGFGGNIVQSMNIMERYWGYRWALRQSGVAPCEEWLWKDLTEEAGPFILPDKLPEAFVCSDNAAAFHLANTWRQANLQNQGAAALASFDDFRITPQFRCQLASYQVDAKQMAEAAFRQMLRRIRVENMRPASYVIHGHLSALS